DPKRAPTAKLPRIADAVKAGGFLCGKVTYSFTVWVMGIHPNSANTPEPCPSGLDEGRLLGEPCLKARSFISGTYGLIRSTLGQKRRDSVVFARCSPFQCCARAIRLAC